MATDEDERPRPERRMTKAAAPVRKTALVVLGMHRSGTSAMARVLSLSGAALPAKLYPAAPGNDLGHWEPQEVADLNDRIFAELDASWEDIFGPNRHGKAPRPILKYLDAATKIIRENWADQPVIVIKDPRMNLLIELWSQALQDEGYRPVYVIMTRHPVEVAESLKKRDGFPRNQSLILWAKYMLAAETGTRNAPRLFVRYDDLLTEPDEVLDRVESSLDVVLPRRSWLATAEIDRFLTTDARHHNAKGKSFRKTLPAVQNYYDYIESAASGAAANEDASAELRDWLASLELAVGPIVANLESNLREAHRCLRVQNDAMAEANARLAEAEASITKREQELLTDIEEAHDRQRAELEGALAEARQAHDDSLREIEAAHALERDHFHRDLEEARAQIASLTELQVEVRRTFEDRVQEVEAQRAELESTLADARQAHDDSLRHLAAQRAMEREQLYEELQEAQARSAVLTALEAERAAERADLALSLEETRAQLTSVMAAEDEARRTLSDTIVQLEAADEVARGLRQEVTELRELVAAQKADILASERDKAKIASKGNVERALQASELNRMTQEVEQSNSRARSLEEELAIIRSRLNETQSAKERLEAQSAQLAQTVTQMIAERVKETARRRLFFFPFPKRLDRAPHR